MNRIAYIGCLCASFLVLSRQASGVTIDWVPVGNPGNASLVSGGAGSVSYPFQIDKYDVINLQYAEFLNAKDPSGTNPLQLYNPLAAGQFGGIRYNAANTDGSKYTLINGAEHWPVNFVSWFSAARFANWLNNGQGDGDTETGAYTLLGGTPVPSNWFSVDRNSSATVFLPNRDEWVKAAYYNPATASYFKYATGSDTIPLARQPTSIPNSANYGYVVGGLTDVGAYTNTKSPYGLFDTEGNVYQWGENEFAGARLTYGSTFVTDISQIGWGTHSGPQGVSSVVGFRVAMVPEPSSLVLAALGLIGLVVWQRRKRS